MAKNEAKIRFSAETGEFNDQIKQSNAELAKLRAEMKQNDEQMKATGESVEGLQERQKLLAKQLESSRAKTEALSQKVEKAKQIYGENSTEVMKLQTQLINAQTAEQKLQRQIDTCNDALDEQRAAANRVDTETEKLNGTIGEQQNEINKLKNEYTEAVLKFGAASDEAKNLAEEIDYLSGELKQNKKTLENAENAANDLDRSLDDLDDATDNAKDGFTVLDGAVSTFAGNLMTKAFDAIGNLISNFKNLSQETQEYREDIGKLETAWQSAGQSSALATETYKNFYSVLGEEDRSIEAVNHLAKFVETEKDMTKWTDIATGVWGTFGDSLPIEGLTEASNEVSKSGKLTGVLVDALVWAGIEEENFQKSLDKCNTEQERASFITETLNGLYSEAAENYKENNKSIIEARKATSDYTDAQAELGEAMEPLNTEITQLKTEFAKELTPTIKKDIIPAFKDFIKIIKNTDVVSDISNLLGELASSVLPPLASILGFVTKNWKLLSVGIGTAVAAFKTLKVISTVTVALKTATGAMAGLNAVMAANPIGAVVTAITALVSVISILVSSYKNAKNEIDYVTEAFQKNIEMNEQWQETMDSARMELGDYSNFANAAGETTSSLKDKVSESQEKITEIYSKAFNEHRSLRQSEIQAIKKYNDEYIKAQNELVKLEQQKLKAQADALQWKLDNMELTAEEEQGILNTLKEIRQDYNNSLSTTIQDELVLLEQRYSNGQISQFQYNTLKEQALAKQQEYAEKEKAITQSVVDNTIAKQAERFEIDTADYLKRQHTFASLEEIELYHAEKVKQINQDESLSWWDKQWAIRRAQDAMNMDMIKYVAGQEVTWTDYNFLTDENIQKNQQAFFNWIANNKENGIELSEDSKNNAAAILRAYASLPEDLQESGLQALQGFAAGMDDQFPTLKNAANMDMETLLKEMNSALGTTNYTPSTKAKKSGEAVVEGLEAGIDSPKAKKSLWDRVKELGDSINNTFKRAFGINSPSKLAFEWGEFITAGLSLGIDDSTDNVVNAVKNQVDAIQDAYRFDGIFTPNPMADLDPYLNSENVLQNKLQTNISDIVQKNINNSGLFGILQAVEALANRPIALNINGQRFAMATAGDTDTVNGNRIALSKRGLSL